MVMGYKLVILVILIMGPRDTVQDAITYEVRSREDRVVFECSEAQRAVQEFAKATGHKVRTKCISADDWDEAG